MFYLVYFFIATTLVGVADAVYKNNVSWSVALVLCWSWLMLVPSLQYGVGTDYFNYVSYVDGSASLNRFYARHEYLFLFVVLFVGRFSLDPQFLFVTIALIQTALFVNILRVMKRNGFNLVILFFVVFTSTGIFHNQLNVIRTYVSVLFFVNAVLYKSEGKDFKTFVFGMFSALWHPIALFALLTLLLPRRFYIWAAKKSLFIFVVLSIFFVTGSFVYIFIEIVNLLTPFYSHYIDRMQPGEVLGLLTRLVYLPFYGLFFLFFYACRRLRCKLYDFDMVLLGYFSIFVPVGFGIIHWHHLFRLENYFSFFSVIPIYFVLMFDRSRKYTFGFLAVFLLFLYSLKVGVFPHGEYKYRAIIFPDFPLYFNIFD